MTSLIRYFLWVLISAIVILFVYFFVGITKEHEDVEWGVTFSQKQIDFLKLDSRETYSALINELGFKKVKISVYWDLIELEKGVYDFEELDWELKEAKNNNVEVILSIGMRVPRWPECHIPEWAEGVDKEEQQEHILDMLETVVSRYKDYPNISGWQVENEVFVNFGTCPWTDKKFFEKEVSFVKLLDNEHPVIVTDSGELSFWIESSQINADIVGITTYRKVWSSDAKMYMSYILNPTFYERRMNIVNSIFGKEVIGTELQAEPWCPNSINNATLEEQAKTMDLEQFKKNVSFAKQTGIKTFYFWGGEWWYYMKTINNDDSIWNEVKKLLK
ncbi:MAG: hypothetical protein WC909_03050 [Candidatus Paceibacterota bacterium]|jgi:hypothetical protein